MAEWITYSKSEVVEFHPVCEKALNLALKNLGLDADYEVLHHYVTGTIEMDFAIQNKSSKKFLCVVEVKRTPSAVNSMRYQYQASSYVENSYHEMEKPFYILTNLEYTYSFRYDAARPGVLRQMLDPGLEKTELFKNTASEDEFLTYLVPFFEKKIADFIGNRYNYMLTLDDFRSYMERIKDKDKEWKSSLALLLFEYLRGTFATISRPTTWNVVSFYHNDVELVCHEGNKIDFKGIFAYNALLYMKKYALPTTLLSNINKFGKQNITGENIADVLHSIVSEGNEHDGEVPTDSELADVVAALAKHYYGSDKVEGEICDPAAGSGNLLAATARNFSIEPCQVKANDINIKLLELLTLRLGLVFPSTVEKTNAPQIDSYDIADLDKSYFEKCKIIVMNPPFLAGINAGTRKIKIQRKILELSGHKATCDVDGQAGLESVFLELICKFAVTGTTIVCIIPKTHLSARGIDAVSFRRMLLTQFGLQMIFDYPRLGLFEEVVKDTCVIVGKVRMPAEKVEIVSSHIKIADIDLDKFEEALNEIEDINKFHQIAYGIDARREETKTLLETVNQGWTVISKQNQDAEEFLCDEILSNPALVKVADVDNINKKLKRGRNNNKGAKELIYIDLNEELYSKVKGKIKHLLPGMANADSTNNHMDVGLGYCKFFSSEDMKSTDVDYVISEYSKLQNDDGKQTKKIKTVAELKNLMTLEENYSFPANNILIPRNIRKYAQVYFLSNNTYVSTNFFCLNTETERYTEIVASWMTTIFYQLICETNQKDQEGARKMEKEQITATYIPQEKYVSDEEYALIHEEIPNIEFLDLKNPSIRKIDELWAEILWQDYAAEILDKALEHLQLLSLKRNG